MPAGSKPGERRGGRAKGVPNRKNREAIAKAEASGIMPLEVMLGTMRKLWADDQHIAASAVAEKAAPYVHQRLASVEHTGKDGGPMEHKDVTDETRARAFMMFLAKTAKAKG